MNYKLPSDPHLRRWMMFVDGENFTIRGQKFCSENSIKLSGPEYWEKNNFLWMPNIKATKRLHSDSANLNLQELGIRAFYYTSISESHENKKMVEDKLHTLGFNPKVFLKERQDQKSKGVDVQMTTDLLSNAYLNNYDVALVFTGDADFIPAIEEVKRLGKIVYICFFLGNKTGFSPKLSLKSDINIDITDLFESKWNEYSAE